MVVFFFYFTLTHHHHRSYIDDNISLCLSQCVVGAESMYALNIILIDNNLQQLMIISAILKRHLKYLYAFDLW